MENYPDDPDIPQGQVPVPIIPRIGIDGCQRMIQVYMTQGHPPNVSNVAQRGQRRWVQVRDTGCILFNGKVNKWGYHQGKFQGHMLLLHRVAFVATHGRDLQHTASHLCDRPACFNGAHITDEPIEANNRRKGCSGPIRCRVHDRLVWAQCVHNPQCIERRPEQFICCLAAGMGSSPPPALGASSQSSVQQSSLAAALSPPHVLSQHSLHSLRSPGPSPSSRVPRLPSSYATQSQMGYAGELNDPNLFVPTQPSAEPSSSGSPIGEETQRIINEVRGNLFSSSARASQRTPSNPSTPSQQQVPSQVFDPYAEPSSPAQPASPSPAAQGPRRNPGRNARPAPGRYTHRPYGSDVLDP